MQKPEYIFSFTAASLRLNEMVKVAQYAHEHGIPDLRQVKKADIVFGSVKAGSLDRQFREIRKRLEGLTSQQVELLTHGDLISQRKIGLLAVCKHYEFIKDFIIEVVREKTLVFSYQLNESDFNSFIKSKQQEHPELEMFEETTFKKAKQVLFLILEQAGIIDNVKDKRIQPQLLNATVVKAIAEDNRNLLKIFMFSDRDIKDVKL